MNWLQAQMVLLDAATAVVQFAANWFLQSALLVAVGLATGRLLAARGSAVQSAVYRTTLFAVLICPTASSLLSLAGVSGWSLAMPRPWSYEQTETLLVDSAPLASQSTLDSLPAAVDAPSPVSLSAGIDEPEVGTLAVNSSPSLALDPAKVEHPSPLASEQPIATPPAAVTAAAVPTGAVPMGAVPAPVPPAMPALAVHPFGWVAVVISAVWLLVSAVLLARVGTAWWRMTHLRRGAQVADAATAQICRDLATQLAVAPPQVLRSPYLPSPCLAGLRRPVVLLPEVDLGPSVRDVLLHELAHLARRDCHWNLLRLVALSAFFFQPLLWKLSRRLEMTAEEVCDDYVVQFGGDPIEYAYRLVDIAELCTAPMAVAGVGIVSLGSMLARRVQRIMDTSRSLSTRVGSALLALVLIGGFVGTAIVGLVGVSPKHSIAEAQSTGGEEKASQQQPATAAEPDVAPTPPLTFERGAVQLPTESLEVWSLSFSEGDRFLAASGRGGGVLNEERTGQVRIWDFAKREDVASYPTPRGVHSVALARDGRRVAYSSWSGDIWLREVGGRQLVHETYEAPLCVALSPDGKLLVGATERSQLRTWDALTGELLDETTGKFRGQTFHFRWIGFSPDGKYLAAAGGQNNEAAGLKIAVYDSVTREQLYTLKDYPVQIPSASFSPDSQTLAVCGGTSIALYDLPTGRRSGQTEEAAARIERIQFSPDGSQLASAGGMTAEGGVVTLWDPTTGKAVGKLAGHKQDVRALAFTHDSKTLATGSPDRTIRLWDVAERRQAGLLPESKAPADADEDDGAAAILAVAYSPDGTSAATADEDGKLSVYRLAPPRLLRSWNGHADAIAALAWSPDGKTLASSGNDKMIKSWNPATGELVGSLGGHTGWVVSLAYSHDGQTLASGSYDRTIRLWNTADGRARLTLAGHTATVRSLAFSHDDKLLASGSSDQSVRLWNAADGHELSTLLGHRAVVRSVAFSPDDRLLASGGEDQVIKLWNVETRDLRGTLTGHSDIVSTVGFAQQTLVSGGWDGTIRTWDVGALTELGKIVTGPSAVAALAITPDGRGLLTAGADQSLTLWTAKAASAQASISLGQYRSFPWSAAFSPDGSSLAVAAAGFSDQTDLYLYDSATKAEKYHVTLPGGARSLAFAPKGDVLALGFSNQQLMLVDPATGRQQTLLEELPGDVPPPLRERVTEVAFSADGKLLAAAALDNDIRIYDMERHVLVKTLSGHTGRVRSIAFSPDQQSLVSGSRDKTAIVWDLATGLRRLSLPEQPGDVLTVAWSPDGKLLATGCAAGKSVCCLWNAETGTLRKTIAAHHGSIMEVRFSPDGQTLATGGADRLAKLWDVASGDLLHSYDPNAGKVLCLRFSPDGKSLVTTGRDGGASLWPLQRSGDETTKP